MAERHPLPSRLSYLDAANPSQLYEVASLRMDAVQALIVLLLREEHPEHARVPRHTLSSAHALLVEAGVLYQRAFATVAHEERA